MALLRRKNGTTPDALPDLATLRSRRAALQAKLDAAEIALETAISDRRRRMLEDDLDISHGEPVRDIVGDLRDARDATGDALVALTAKIEAAEIADREARDKAEREKASAELLGLVEAASGAVAQFTRAAAAMAAAIEPVTTRVPHARRDLGSIVTALGRDLAGIGEAVLVEARAHARDLVERGAVIVAPSPPPPPASPAPPTIERIEIYCMSPLRWREGEQVRMADRYSFAHPPTAVAELAIMRNLGDRRGSERVARLIEAFGVSHGLVSPDLCIDLDRDIDPAAASPSESGLSPGAVETIGPARTMAVERNRF